MGAIANYVIDLLTESLGEQPQREKTFPWALGDISPKTGRAARLPFDAVWESRRLIVEIDEDQHRKPVAFWDKPTVMTVSGVSRAEQRAIYAQRKRDAARANGYTVIEIPWERRSPPDNRDRAADLAGLRELLASRLGRTRRGLQMPSPVNPRAAGAHDIGLFELTS